MDNFIRNFRLVSGTRMPLTRGNLQKGESVGNLIPSTEGRGRNPQGKKTQVIDFSHIMPSQEEIRKRKWSAARKGTLFIDEPKDSGRTLYIDPQTSAFNGLQVAENFDRLNSVVDDFDAAKTWEDRMSIIKNAYNGFPEKSEQLNNWFDNFARLTSAAMDPEGDHRYAPEEISEAVRYYLKSAKDKFFREA